jgi:glycosyltransferase involved in cell wall biosynthesis
MMGCGTLVVANHNKANTWFLVHGENCLISEPTASCLADTLVDALENYESYEPIRKRAVERIRAEHGNWSATMRSVASFMHQPDQSA